MCQACCEAHFPLLCKPFLTCQRSQGHTWKSQDCSPGSPAQNLCSLHPTRLPLLLAPLPCLWSFTNLGQSDKAQRTISLVFHTDVSELLKMICFDFIIGHLLIFFTHFCILIVHYVCLNCLI